MIIFHDPQCAEYGSNNEHEKSSRSITTVARLKANHPTWEWRQPTIPSEASILLAHSKEHVARLQYPSDFDRDTPYFPDIHIHARRSVGAALDAMTAALDEKQRAFALMRPPGHHATRSQAMGFCYLNQAAICALAARERGVERVAVWDFDAHHGNGTEDILHDHEGCLFVSVHQVQTYPGTGAVSSGNCRNYCVTPKTPRDGHMADLRRSWEEVLAFKPGLILVSAGFDAYVHDPITSMTLEVEDFAELGRWLAAETTLPIAGIFEGGYSNDLPLLVDSFLTAWAQ